MFLKRTLSAVISIILLILVLVIDNNIIDSIVLVLLSIISINEFKKAFLNINIKVIAIFGYIASFCVFLIDFKINMLYILPVIFISILCITVLGYKKYNITDISMTLLSVLYIPLLFIFLKYIAIIDNGRFFLLFVLAGSVINDTFAYIIGSRFGKNKLCEKLSKNKTIEGSIAGIIGVVIFYVILYFIGNVYYSLDMNIIYVLLFSVVIAIIAQIGDLFASSIKRFCNIKDFSNMIPGHGGILDRCDSIIFIAPIVYLFVTLI
ncbi:MAG: phosphatidate cytidylyltransferase [Clostridia bacterium]